MFAPLPAQTLSRGLVSARCCRQHTLLLLGYQEGHDSVGIFLQFIAFYLTLTSRLPVRTFCDPPPHPPSLTLNG